MTTGNNNILITEKPGNLLVVNLKNKTKSVIKHNLSVLEDGQGGLLEILKNKENVYICYTENRNSGKTSTSIAKAKYSTKNLNFKNIISCIFKSHSK